MANRQRNNGNPSPKVRVLRTAAEIVTALGGNGPVAELTNRKSQHVTNWKATDKLPPETFLVVKHELHRLGYDAPPELWRIASPSRRAAR